MPGAPVSIGCNVLLSPGMSGAPDSGVIMVIMQSHAMGGGLPLATSGAICQMVNSSTGVPYPLSIGPGGSTSVTIGGQALVRVGDMIPSGPGILTILGPPAAPFITDTGSP